MSDEELIDRIDAIDPVHAETMRAFPPAFVREPVPFYRKFQLLIAKVRLRHRLLEFHYADDGSQICILRATPEYIYVVNELEGLQLDATQVPAYLRFFFDNLTGPRIVLVDREEEVRWLARADGDPDLRKRKEQAAALILQPMQVTPLEGDRYRVLATAVADTRLMEVDLVVTRDGHVDVNSQRPLIENLPVVEVFP